MVEYVASELIRAGHNTRGGLITPGQSKLQRWRRRHPQRLHRYATSQTVWTSTRGLGSRMGSRWLETWGSTLRFPFPYPRGNIDKKASSNNYRSVTRFVNTISWE